MKIKFTPTPELMAYTAPTAGLICMSAGEYECTEEAALKVIGKFPKNFSMLEVQEEQQPEEG